MHMNRLYVFFLGLMVTPMLAGAQGNDISKLERDPLRKKLDTIIIDRVRVEDAKASLVFDFLKERSKALDPQGRGVMFKLKLRPKNLPAKEFEEPTVTLDLYKLPLYDVVRYACLNANLRYKMEAGQVVILGPEVEEPNFEHRVFNVPTSFVDGWKVSRGTHSLLEYFQEMGVGFPEITGAGNVSKASLNYDSEAATLSVFNLPENNERLRTILSYIVLGQKPENETPLKKKLRTLVISKISLVDTPILTAFEFLKNRSYSLDPDNYTMNVVPVLRRPEKVINAKELPLVDNDDGFADNDDDNNEKEAVVNERTITLDFDNIPLGMAFHYICEQAGLEYILEKNAVVIQEPDGGRVTPLSLRFFSLKPDVVDSITSNGNRTLKKTLQLIGARFPTMSSGEKATMAYDRASGIIVSSNTRSAHTEMAKIIENLTNPPKTLYENPLDEKLDSIVLKNVRFNDGITNVVELLYTQSRRVDPTSKGVEIRFAFKDVFGDDNKVDLVGPIISINMNNVTIRNVLDDLCQRYEMVYRVSKEAVLIWKPGVENFGFETAFLPVSTELFTEKLPRAFFEEKGVSFPTVEARIILDRHNQQIIVRNSTENIRRMRTILRALQK